jgi:hypothetical protein
LQDARPCQRVQLCTKREVSRVSLFRLPNRRQVHRPVPHPKSPTFCSKLYLPRDSAPLVATLPLFLIPNCLDNTNCDDSPTTTTMSSPSRRSTRSSATPRRSAAGGAERTPRQTRTSQLASSPLFYQSSSPAAGPSSNSQSTAQPPPSSPLRQNTESQETGDRTPRASAANRNRLIGGESSPPSHNV